MNVFDRINAFLCNLLLVAGGVCLVAMMLLACANMVLRAVWLPITGSYELLGFLGALATAFGLGATQIRKGHIALTILEGVFPPRVERVVDICAHAACAALFVLVAWRTTAWGTSLIDSGELSETLRFAYHPFVFAVAFGCLVLALAIFCDMLHAILDPMTRHGRKRGGARA
ncbi:MAG: TRAP transporter small permease [Desulfovibrionaceae bacterium]